MGRLRKALGLAALLFAWHMTPAQAGSTLLMSESSKFCLDAAGASTQNGTPIIMYWCQGGWNQVINFTNGQMRIGNKCLDAAGGTGRAGDKVILFDCHNGPNQKWRVVNGKQIVGMNGLCLDIWNNAWWPWVGVQLWPCHGGSNQNWLGSSGPVSAQSRGISPQVADQAFQASWTSRRAPVIGNDAGSMVSAGNSNIVAAGGGNIVAAGGGNLAAAGGGN